MNKTKITLWTSEEYSYGVGGFLPNIMAYLHEDDKTRPAVLVVPGGAYMMVAIGEGEIVAKRFYDMGYQAFVLSYTATCFQPEPLRLRPLKDISRAVARIREDADSLGVDAGKIALCGFSAGANLCANLAVHFDDHALLSYGGAEGLNRPDAVVLSYPVISSDEGVAHGDTFRSLCGPDSTKDDWDYFSAEKHVKANTPPIFLWHTATDEMVPVQNSFRMAAACQAQQIPYELHIFPEGPHGYSLATEEWATGEYGDDYCMEQFFLMMQYYIDNELEPPAPFNAMRLPKGTDYRTVFRSAPKDYLNTKANAHVAIWPELAQRWLALQWNREAETC